MSARVEVAERLRRLPPYLFAEIDRQKREVRARGVDRLGFAEAARCGWVNINASTNYWESHLPFGGRAGSVSGRGRVGGATVLEQLTELKTIVYSLQGEGQSPSP